MSKCFQGRRGRGSDIVLNTYFVFSPEKDEVADED